MRDVFALRIETARLPELKPKQEKMIRAALRSGCMSPGREILSTVQIHPFFHSDGRTVTMLGVVDADADRMLRGLKWIVRGLHYHRQQQVMPEDADFQWYAFQGAENKHVFDKIWPQPAEGPETVGGALTYKVKEIRDVPSYSQWLLVFYDRVFFIVTVNERELLQRGVEAGYITHEELAASCLGGNHESGNSDQE